VRDLLDRSAEAVVGDLADPEETRGVAAQVNRLGRMDAVTHIDAIIALCMALDRVENQPEPVRLLGWL
jgi:hypothetical protein